jgi:hypothetical protein
MLSEAKHLDFSAACEDEILRLRFRMTIATRSFDGEGIFGWRIWRTNIIHQRHAVHNYYFLPPNNSFHLSSILFRSSEEIPTLSGKCSFQ